MKKNSILVKSVLMSMLTAASFSFIACSDDVEIDNAPAALETESKGILGASADNFNINDLEFNAETWRDQEAIYLSGNSLIDPVISFSKNDMNGNMIYYNESRRSNRIVMLGCRWVL